MFNSQKFLLMVFIFLFVIVFSELFYFFYYQPFIFKKTLPTAQDFSFSVKSNNAVGLPFIFDKKSASQNGDQVKEIVSVAKKNGRIFTSYTNFLKAVMVGNKNCLAEKKCFQLNNTTKKEWKNDTDKDFPITISGPFVMRLNYYGHKEPSGISIDMGIKKDDEYWWENVKNIFFGIGKDGRQLYIDAKNNSPDPLLIYENTFDKKIEGIYILFNEIGTSFLITDLSYNKIAFIDINEVTNNKFPDGLFPDKNFYIGYAIAPLSNLVVYDFSIL